MSSIKEPTNYQEKQKQIQKGLLEPGRNHNLDVNSAEGQRKMKDRHRENIDSTEVKETEWNQ